MLPHRGSPPQTGAPASCDPLGLADGATLGGRELAVVESIDFEKA